MKNKFSYDAVNCVVIVNSFVYVKDVDGNQVPTTLYKYTGVNLQKELVTGVTNTKLKKNDFFFLKSVKAKNGKTYSNVELVPKLTELNAAFGLVETNVNAWNETITS